MIPKIIHYCWFGGKELPTSVKRCISSWEKHLPDYQIKRWDEHNFDVGMTRYTSEAYSKKKYAFVSDVARLWCIYNHGGLYLDTDVELIAPLDAIVSKGPFMARENNSASVSCGVNPGLGFGAEPYNPVIKELLEEYMSRRFILPDGKMDLRTIVESTSAFFERKGLRTGDTTQYIEGMTIYPKDFFCPIDCVTGKVQITENTVAIHHFDASWANRSRRLRNRLKKFVGPVLTKKIIQLKKAIKD